MHHCAKFHQNQSNGCGDMVIYWFSKWQACLDAYLNHSRRVLSGLYRFCKILMESMH